MKRAVVCAAFCAAACVQDIDRDLQDDVTIVAEREGTLTEAATARLARRGVRAIPSIETALHTARPSGRANLIVALRRIGDRQAVPILRHFGRYDADEAVRREALYTLRSWNVPDAGS